MVSGRKPDVSRRAEISRLRARGLTFAEIGRRLGISKQGVHAVLTKSRQLPRRRVPCADCATPIESTGVLPSDEGGALCLPCLVSRPDVSFGARLKAFRLAAGLMKAELAKRVGLSPMTIHYYEAGLREPRWPQIAPFVRVLGPELVTLGLTRRE
jgi:transcriptional regulator with XRE-family HTH domain